MGHHLAQPGHQEMPNACTVQEVSLTALWKPFEGLMTADVGDLLYELRHEYPRATEAAATPPWTDNENELSSGRGVTDNETLRHSWRMTNEPGNTLVGFQFDRITCSWRRSSSGNAYPGYMDVRTKFAHLVAVTGRWLASKHVLDAGLPEDVQQVQVDYVNQIDITPNDLLTGIVCGWQKPSPRSSSVVTSLIDATLPVEIGQPERGETILTIESDGSVGSTVTVTSATKVERGTGYLANLDRARAYCQQASSLITPEQVQAQW